MNLVVNRAERIAKLRAYFLDVTRDLLMRGVIRRNHGESVESILKKEFVTVAQEVGADISVIGAEMGVGLITTLARRLGAIVGDGAQAVADVFTKR